MSDFLSENQVNTRLKSFVEELGKFLSCLATNYRRNVFYYKNFVFGDNGRPGYLRKVYPKILVDNILNCKEDVLFIVTEDLDFSEFNDLLRIWNEITLRTIKNEQTFSVLPQFQNQSEKCIEVSSRSNNSIHIHYCGVPRSLEYQVAKINMVENNLSIPNSTQNNDHEFLNEIAEHLKLNIKELIEKSVQLLQNENWVKEIKKLIWDFECS